VKCALVNEGGASHRWPVNIRPESRVGPSDVEQNLFPAARYGIDQCDLHVAIAPRPLLALIEEYSPRFNITADHIRSRYQQLGVPEQFATGEATDPHAWTVKLRLAATDWFWRSFYNRSGPTQEPTFEPEKPETLYCTPGGSVGYSRQGETIFSLMLKKQASLRPPRKIPSSPSALAAFREQMSGEIQKLLHYRKPDSSLEVRQVVTTQRKGYRIEKIEFLSEPGIYIPTWVFVPDGQRESREPVLFVNEAGKQADGMEFGLYEALAHRGKLVVAVDVRGIGETRRPHDQSSDRRPFSHLFDVDTAISYMAWFMDESLFGMRVQDVVRSVDYALSRPDTLKTGVRVIGQGAGALWVLYAAALDPRITTVVAKRGLLSYRNLAQVDRYTHGAGVFIRDVLLYFDLPQVAAAVAGRRLTIFSPLDAMKRPAEIHDANEAYKRTSAAYQAADADDHFLIALRTGETDPIAVYFA
jgi:cephalosporin-C deacetylase-like acetyl esterase